MGEIPAPVTDPLPPSGRTWTGRLDRLHDDCTGQSQDEGVVMKMRSTYLLKGLAALLAAGALAVPGALGSDLSSPDTQEAAKAGQWGSVSDMLLPDTQDAANGRGGAGPTIEVVTVAAPSGFDWIDAGIGAASGLGVSLVAAGGLVLVLRRHRRSVAVA
jgi:hypothetical protein